MTRFSVSVIVIALFSFFIFAGCGGEQAEQAEKPAADTHGDAAKETAMDEKAPGGGMDAIAELLKVDLADMVTHESGLEWIVRQEGTGAVPEKGQTITAHYTGYLTSGQKFDSSVDRGQPFQTPIGVGRVIQGWDIAFTDMKVGEKRVLFIPPDLGYGPRGAGGVIPPNADLVFDVELLDVK